MKTNILDNPAFVAVVEKGLEAHEVNIAIGNLIRKDFPKPLEAFPEISRKKIMEVLVATCSNEEEIQKVLVGAGFNSVMISIMEKPVDEAGKQAMALCQAMGGTLTKEGLPCMIME